MAAALPLHRENSLREVMEQLYAANFALIPLGGPDGKKPLIAGWKGRRIPLEACLRRMANDNSQSYGIRLDGLLVVDIDTDNQETRDYFAGRFQQSDVVVRTGRGAHHYYRCEGFVPKAVRSDEVSIDFKAGSAQFVVGPGSTRPDGRLYLPVRGTLGSSTLPVFRDRAPTAPANDGGKVQRGQRNGALWRRAVEYAPLADDFDGLLADLVALRDIEFDDAASVPDAEIQKVADWAWKLRLEGKLWAGRNSEMGINRLATDLLLPRPDGADALALYILLVSNHGHQPGKTFAVVPDAIIAAGLLGMSRRQIYRSRDVLIEVGLLAIVRKGRVKQPNQYRLQSPRVVAALNADQGGRVYPITFSASEAHEALA
ncbi:bifunctional DNA primase/polymerase [Aminobacter sp. SR38]|jgi:hypothetical protein|uniref:bifunctional DNA primase/polymerase n=1 Tax=Aminobacter sp. SR38 TaxID=2774562 RepID=UPI001781991C|nr:bifunctional DNA primase/polymerase [Aminobacter sp. SR38]QOF71873.1 bifunctional DNA primase/polymerase [Aminobacter sp. SR38]